MLDIHAYASSQQQPNFDSDMSINEQIFIKHTDEHLSNLFQVKLLILVCVCVF